MLHLANENLWQLTNYVIVAGETYYKLKNCTLKSLLDEWFLGFNYQT